MSVEEDKMRAIAREVMKEEVSPIVTQSVNETLERLGIDASDPIIAQHRAHTLARITYLLDKGGVVAWTTAIGLVVTGVLITIWQMVTIK